MALEYSAVQWNRQKRIYDFVLAGGVGAFLVLFGLLSKVLFPLITDEIMLMRAFAAAAFILLHVILCIGPLCRLNRKFLPLLYNRRHAGVTMCLLALIHAALVIVTYHAGGDTNPILGIFKGSPLTNSIAGVPFQPFGFFALVILLLMAATSHDFWLNNLSPAVWKTLHMLIYPAYGAMVLHVLLGAASGHGGSLLYVGAAAFGFAIIAGLHLTAAVVQAGRDRATQRKADHDWIDAGPVSDIPDKRARIVAAGATSIAIFRYDGKLSAISNACAHQMGPLGEGCMIDGLVTCPWHGWQYDPATGRSPAPYTEKVETFAVRVQDGRVFVNPAANPKGTPVAPAMIG